LYGEHLGREPFKLTCKIVSGDSEHDDVDALVAGSRLIIGSIYFCFSEENLMFEIAKTADYNRSHTNKLYAKDGHLVYQKLVFFQPTHG
jgi:hypothetical protein